MKTKNYFRFLLFTIPILIGSCSGGEKVQETKEIMDPETSESSDSENAQYEVDIKEWPVPWENSGTRDPFVAPDGMVWFCGQGGNYVAYLDPGSGEFKRFELEKGTHPHNLIVDDDGFVWYAGNRNAHIGKLDPKDGSITKFDMPDPNARDPHTLVFDEEGNIWFTVQGGNFIGHLNTETGDVKLVAVPTSNARPYGIKMGPNNSPWIVLFGTNKLAKIDPATFELIEIPLPNSESRPRRIEITSAGIILYADYSRGYVGQYDPGSNTFDEWPLPGGDNSRPYGTAMDQNDQMWLAEAGLDPNRLVGFDPETHEFFSITDIPSGGRTIRHMYFHPPTQEIWFGTDTNNIGRARIGS